MNYLKEVEGLRPSEVRDMLEANAMSIQEEYYSEPVDPDELDEMKDQFISLSVKMAGLEDEKTEFMSQWKDRMKPVKEDYTAKRAILKTGQIEKHGPLFYIPNFETKRMLIVNEDGKIVRERDLRPSENQMNISQVRKIG